MSEKKKSPLLAVGAILVGIASLPVAGFVSWVAGLVMMALPIFMILNAG